jgi:hypothetical protein
MHGWQAEVFHILMLEQHSSHDETSSPISLSRPHDRFSHSHSKYILVLFIKSS